MGDRLTFGQHAAGIGELRSREHQPLIELEYGHAGSMAQPRAPGATKCAARSLARRAVPADVGPSAQQCYASGMCRRTSVALWLLIASSAIVAASCGGIAIVDPAGGTGGTGSGHSDGGSPICVTPSPVGTLFECGTTVSPTQCSAVLCDEAGNRWESSCEPSGCRCLYNGNVKCTCVSEGTGHPCDGRTPLCCPEPFPHPAL